VLLGDSVMIAQSARKDLGVHFREAGFSAVNFGFVGYGLYHYRDVYRSRVIGRGLLHHWVVVMITIQNDVANSPHYLKVKESGGDWQDYLNRPTSFGWPNWADGTYTPWSVSLIVKVPDVLRQRLNTEKKKNPVIMPRGTVMADDSILWAPDVAPGSPERQAAKDALRDLILDATNAGANVVLALGPNSALIYGPYMKGHKAKFGALEQNRNRFISFLNKRFAGNNVTVVYLTDPLRKHAGIEPISTTELDCHLNDRGVEIVFQVLQNIFHVRVKVPPRFLKPSCEAFFEAAPQPAGVRNSAKARATTSVAFLKSSSTSRSAAAPAWPSSRVAGPAPHTTVGMPQAA
jgi:hypothetical protein